MANSRWRAHGLCDTELVLSTWENPMPDRAWRAVVLVLCLLSGCSANYVFDDADYRPLGDAQATRRGQ